MVALFFIVAVPPPPPQKHAKSHRGRNKDDSKAKKRERRELEVVRRASIADEEALQLRAIELVVGSSRSKIVEAKKSTTDGVVIIQRRTCEGCVETEDTTEGVYTTEVVGSWTPDPPSC